MKILCYLGAFCLLSQAFGQKRFLDSTLFVARDKLEVTNGVAPLHFKCGSEWAAVFTDNGQTITLKTLTGSWTLTGLSSDVASAAVSEGAPLVSAIAGGVGVSDVEEVTTSTLALASKLASAIGSPAFDAALSMAVDTANDILDDSNVHPSDFNKEILDAIPLLGPSGTVIDASDVTVADVHEQATKTIGLILSALASTGVVNIPEIPAGLPTSLGDYSLPTTTEAAESGEDVSVASSEDVAALPAIADYPVSQEDLPAAADIALSGVDASALAAYAAAGGK